MRHGWSIFWKCDRNASGRTGTSKAAGEKLDGSGQALILLVATNARGWRTTLLARLTIMTETRSAGNTSTVQIVCGGRGLVRTGEAVPAVVPLVPTYVGSAAVRVEHICLRWRGGIGRARTVMLLRAGGWRRRRILVALEVLCRIWRRSSILIHGQEDRSGFQKLHLLVLRNQKFRGV